MTSSNGNIFRVTGHLCGEFTGSGEFPAQRPVTRSFDVFFDLRLNKRLSKQSWGWWLETLSRPLWRHRNDRIEWLMASKHFEISSRQTPVMAQSLTFSSQSSMRASLCGVSFQISWLVHWHKTMLIQKSNDLITHKGFYHLRNMIYGRCWTIIIFVINVTIVLIHRRHSGVLPVLLKDTRLRDFLSHLRMI